MRAISPKPRSTPNAAASPKRSTVSLKQLRKLKTKAASLPESAAEEIGYLLDAHVAMLSNSRLVRGVDERVRRARINAERAVEIEIDEIAKSFAAMRDPYLAARIEDIRVVGTRLIRNLIKKPYVAYSGVPEGAIILADELTPADTALMDPRRIAGFAAQFGGADSHTAIVARALGLPAVLAVPALIVHARAATTVVIDGTEGTVILDPSAETIGDYEARRGLLVREQRHLTRLRRLPAATRDGVEITLEANLELPVELAQAAANGAMGLGLVRSEFLYMNRDDLPGEEEQYAVFSGLVRGMAGKPVTVRTFDLGGDKLARSIERPLRPGRQPGARPARDPPLLAGPPPARPAAGGDAARRRRGAAAHPVADDLGARRNPPGARSDGAGRPPAAAARHARAQAAAALGGDDRGAGGRARRRRARRRGRFLCHRHQRPHPIHARRSTAATSRWRISTTRCTRRCCASFNSRSRRRCAAACRSASAARWPASRALPRCLLGLGLRDLSMAPRNIPRVKQRIRNLDMVAATRRARAIMDQSDSGRIAALIDDFNAVAWPH